MEFRISSGACPALLSTGGNFFPPAAAGAGAGAFPPLSFVFDLPFVVLTRIGLSYLIKLLLACISLEKRQQLDGTGGKRQRRETKKSFLSTVASTSRHRRPIATSPVSDYGVLEENIVTSKHGSVSSLLDHHGSPSIVCLEISFLISPDVVTFCPLAEAISRRHQPITTNWPQVLPRFWATCLFISSPPSATLMGKHLVVYGGFHNGFYTADINVLDTGSFFCVLLSLFSFSHTIEQMIWSMGQVKGGQPR